MCGFTGFASHQKQNILPLLKANLAIAHRGEDDEGFTMVYQDIKQYSSHHSCPETQLKFPMIDVFQKARVAFEPTGDFLGDFFAGGGFSVGN